MQNKQTGLIPAERQSNSELQTTSEQCRNLQTKYVTELTSEEKETISECLAELVFLRAEKFQDYEFEVWLKYLTDYGYTYDNIIEIIQCGFQLPKFGAIKLAIGDLIYEWENTIGSEFKQHTRYKKELIAKELRELRKRENKIREAEEIEINTFQLIENNFSNQKINKNG